MTLIDEEIPKAPPGFEPLDDDAEMIPPPPPGFEPIDSSSGATGAPTPSPLSPPAAGANPTAPPPVFQPGNRQPLATQAFNGMVADQQSVPFRQPLDPVTPQSMVTPVATPTALTPVPSMASQVTAGVQNARPSATFEQVERMFAPRQPAAAMVATPPKPDWEKTPQEFGTGPDVKKMWKEIQSEATALIQPEIEAMAKEQNIRDAMEHDLRVKQWEADAQRGQVNGTRPVGRGIKWNATSYDYVRRNDPEWKAQKYMMAKRAELAVFLAKRQQAAERLTFDAVYELKQAGKPIDEATVRSLVEEKLYYAGLNAPGLPTVQLGPDMEEQRKDERSWIQWAQDKSYSLASGLYSGSINLGAQFYKLLESVPESGLDAMWTAWEMIKRGGGTASLEPHFNPSRYHKQMATKAQNWLTEQAPRTEDAIRSPWGLEGLLRDLGENAPQLLVTMGLAGTTGGGSAALSALTMEMQAAKDDLEQQLIAGGMSPDEANQVSMTHGAMIGIINAYLEKTGPLDVFLENKGARRFLASAIAKQILSEGATEMLQEIPQLLSQYGLKLSQPQLADIDQILKAGALGGFMGGGTTVVGHMTDRYNANLQKQKEAKRAEMIRKLLEERKLQIDAAKAQAESQPAEPPPGSPALPDRRQRPASVSLQAQPTDIPAPNLRDMRPPMLKPGLPETPTIGTDTPGDLDATESRTDGRRQADEMGEIHEGVDEFGPAQQQPEVPDAVPVQSPDEEVLQRPESLQVREGMGGVNPEPVESAGAGVIDGGEAEAGTAEAGGAAPSEPRYVIAPVEDNPKASVVIDTETGNPVSKPMLNRKAEATAEEMNQQPVMFSTTGQSGGTIATDERGRQTSDRVPSPAGRVAAASDRVNVGMDEQAGADEQDDVLRQIERAATQALSERTGQHTTFKFIDRNDSVAARMQPEEFELADAIVRASTGGRILPFQTRTSKGGPAVRVAVHGMSAEELGNDVGINDDSRMSAVPIAGHEIKHVISDAVPEINDAMNDLVEELADPNEYAKAIDEQMLMGHSLESARNEVGNNVHGDLWLQPEYVNVLAALNPKRWGEVRRAIIRWATKVLNYLQSKGYGTSKMFKDIDQLRRRAAALTEEAARRMSEQRGAAEDAKAMFSTMLEQKTSNKPLDETAPARDNADGLEGDAGLPPARAENAIPTQVAGSADQPNQQGRFVAPVYDPKQNPSVQFSTQVNWKNATDDGKGLMSVPAIVDKSTGAGRQIRIEFPKRDFSKWGTKVTDGRAFDNWLKVINAPSKEERDSIMLLGMGTNKLESQPLVKLSSGCGRDAALLSAMDNGVIGHSDIVTLLSCHGACFKNYDSAALNQSSPFSLMITEARKGNTAAVRTLQEVAQRHYGLTIPAEDIAGRVTESGERIKGDRPGLKELKKRFVGSDLAKKAAVHQDVAQREWSREWAPQEAEKPLVVTPERAAEFIKRLSDAWVQKINSSASASIRGNQEGDWLQEVATGTWSEYARAIRNRGITKRLTAITAGWYVDIPQRMLEDIAEEFGPNGTKQLVLQVTGGIDFPADECKLRILGYDKLRRAGLAPVLRCVTDEFGQGGRFLNDPESVRMTLEYIANAGLRPEDVLETPLHIDAPGFAKAKNPTPVSIGKLVKNLGYLFEMQPDEAEAMAMNIITRNHAIHAVDSKMTEGIKRLELDIAELEAKEKSQGGLSPMDAASLSDSRQVLMATKYSEQYQLGHAAVGFTYDRIRKLEDQTGKQILTPQLEKELRGRGFTYTINRSGEKLDGLFPFRCCTTGKCPTCGAACMGRIEQQVTTPKRGLDKALFHLRVANLSPENAAVAIQPARDQISWSTSRETDTPESLRAKSDEVYEQIKGMLKSGGDKAEIAKLRQERSALIDRASEMEGQQQKDTLGSDADASGRVRGMVREFLDRPAQTQFSTTRNPQEDTPEFKRWFQGSKVVDEEGKPLVVYHGADKQITTFEKGRGAHKESIGMFSSSPEYAKKYARGKGATTHEVYLNIRNPLDVSSETKTDLANVITDDLWDKMSGREQQAVVDHDNGGHGTDGAWVSANLLLHLAKKYGYDGVIWSEGGGKTYLPLTQGQIKSAAGDASRYRIVEGQPRGFLDPIVAFIKDNRTGKIVHKITGEVNDDVRQQKAEQWIKDHVSATGNVGTFDPTNPDIRFSTRHVPAERLDEPWTLGRKDWEKLAFGGKIVQATGKKIPGEEKAKSAIKMGELNGYSPQDVAHWYLKAYGYDASLAYGHYIMDAIREGKNVSDETIRIVFNDDKIQKWMRIRDRKLAEKGSFSTRREDELNALVRMNPQLKEKRTQIPNSIVYLVRDTEGNQSGVIVEKHDGSPEGIAAAAQKAQSRLDREFGWPGGSMTQSSMFSMGPDGKAKYVISPNLQHISEVGTPDAMYTLGDLSQRDKLAVDASHTLAGPEPAPKSIAEEPASPSPDYEVRTDIDGNFFSGSKLSKDRKLMLQHNKKQEGNFNRVKIITEGQARKLSDDELLMKMDIMFSAIKDIAKNPRGDADAHWRHNAAVLYGEALSRGLIPEGKRVPELDKYIGVIDLNKKDQGQFSTQRKWHDIEEGPFDSKEEADIYANAEVAEPYLVRKENDGWHIYSAMELGEAGEPAQTNSLLEGAKSEYMQAFRDWSDRKNSETQKALLDAHSQLTRLQRGAGEQETVLPKELGPQFSTRESDDPGYYEYDPETTSMRKRQISEDREARGLLQFDDFPAHSWQAALEEAHARRIPQEAIHIAASIIENPRAFSDTETAGFAVRIMQLKNDYRELLERMDTTEDETLLKDAREKMTRIEQERDLLEQANNFSKTEKGRALNAQKLTLDKELDLLTVLTKAKIAKGSALTDSERAKFAEQIRQIAELDAQLKEANARTEAAEKVARETAARNAIIELELAVKQESLKPSAKRVTTARLIAERAAAANAKIEERLKSGNPFLHMASKPKFSTTREESPDIRFSTTADPSGSLDISMFRDFVDSAADQIVNANAKFADWSASMVGKFGDACKPYLKDIWNEAQKVADKSKLSMEQEATAAKAVPATDPKDDIRAKLRDRIAEPDADPSSLTFLLQKLAKQHIADGIVDRDKLLDTLHKELIELGLKDITRDETMDALSGYGQYKPLSKDKVDVILRDLKGQYQQLAKLRDMVEKGISPWKTGPERKSLSDEERRLVQQVHAQKNKGSYKVIDPERQLRTALDAIKRRLNNQIADLEKQIADKKKIVKDKVAPPSDAETVALESKRDQLREDFAMIFGRPELTPERRLQIALDATRKSIERYKQMLATGNVMPTKAESKTPASPELDKLKVERDGLMAQIEAKRKEIRDASKPTEEDQQVKALTKQISILEAKLKNNDLSTKTGRATALTKMVTDLKAKRDALNQQLAERRKAAAALTPQEQELRKQESRLKLLNKRIAVAEGKLKVGKWVPKILKPTPTNPAIKAAEANLEALNAQLAELVAHDAAYVEAKRLKQLDAQIAEEEQALKTGQIEPKVKPAGMADSPAVAARRSKLAALKAERTKRLEDSGYFVAQYLARRTAQVADQIAKLEAKVAAGDFALPEPKAEKPTTDELDKAIYKRDFLKSQVRQGINNLKPRSIWERGMEPFNVARSLMTSMDVSAVFRQGGFATVSHPVMGAKAFLPMLKAFRDPVYAHKVAMDMIDADKNPNAVLYQKAGLYLAPTDANASISKQEEEFLGRWVGKIPGIKGSGRAYNTYLNLMRTQLFDALTSTLAKNGTPTIEEARAIANFINISTGRGNLGKGKLAQAAPAAATLFFAPRYTVSRFQLLLGQPLWGGDAKTRKLIAKEYARYAIGMAIVYALGAAAGGDEEKDPRSSDFGKVRFGKTRIDPAAGLIQPAVLASRLVSGQSKSTATGKINDLRSGKPFASDIGDTLANFGRSKLSPMAGYGLDMLNQKDYQGQPLNVAKRTGELFVPLTIPEMVQAFEEQGVPRGTALAILSLMGMGNQTYEDRRAQNAKTRWSAAKSDEPREQREKVD